MPRYIDGDALIARIRRHEERVKGNNEILDKVYGMAHEHIIEIIEDEFPAADVEEVRHGEWIVEDAGDGWKRAICPRCDKVYLYAKGHLQIHVMPRCPNCGAKMDEKENKDE